MKERKGLGVYFNGRDEAEELCGILRSKGWLSNFTNGFVPNGRGYIDLGMMHGSWSGGDSYYSETLTLDEFKRSQNIMKYKIDDIILDKSKSERAVLGICGKAYLISSSENHGIGGWYYTEEELSRRGFTLKDKPETTKTDKTVAQIEKDLNLPAGSLNVVAE